MVEAANPQKTASHIHIGCIQVFEQLEMLWMGIWLHPYTVMPVWVGVNFRKIGA